MKKIGFFSVFFTLAITVNTLAQSRFLALESTTIVVDNVWVHDSVGGGNKPVFSGAFDISLRDAAETITVLSRFQSSLADGKQTSFSLGAANINMDVTEERNYNGVSILEMVLSPLDGADKSIAKIRVKFRSNNLSVNYATKKMSLPFGTKSMAVSSFNYKITIGNMETRRVSNISSLALGNNGRQFFTLELSAQDSREWHDALLKNGGKTETGLLELLAPNMKDVLVRITISDAEIVSYSAQSNNESRAIARVTVGIRARAILIGK
jgi:hypothetical protein